MDFFRQHILSIVAFWPLAGMFVLLFINKENKTLIRWWANLVVFSGFLISLPLWFWFDVKKSKTGLKPVFASAPVWMSCWILRK